MKRIILTSLAALSLCVPAVSVKAAPGDSMGSSGTERMQQWTADHAAMLDAGLAGLKAGLKLTADQEKLWPPFEAAVRDAAKSRMERAMGMMARMQDMQPMREQKAASGAERNPAASPVDRLDAIAQRLQQRADALKAFADAAKPFYASLDPSQQRLFGLLGGDLLMMGHGHHGMAAGEQGMGMMGNGAGGMIGGGGSCGMGMMRKMMGHGMMAPSSKDDEDSQGDE